ncbi:hypothetical protein [Synechococcus sp. PCC 6312]|uniref:hypothetical protein n=1 Tax=Synechococcus sp. (strain ATCC 27167 / PCC 6312) TaxID=195253 RepID=UPI00029ED165|nr:hypothetical protein [Synechococcus sp. PCC 6312]AFY61880.1 hypothetical protein Syn6312_2803 [Synechococcus sp. PCC 6312]
MIKVSEYYSAFGPAAPIQPRTPKLTTGLELLKKNAERLMESIEIKLEHENLEQGRKELLLHPNIPKPLHSLAPRTIKGQKWWDETRKKAYAAQDYHCHACGIHQSRARYRQWLEAHEIYDINYQTGEVKLIEMAALCHACHNFIHDGRMQTMTQKGKYDLRKYLTILKRGNQIIGSNWKEPFMQANPLNLKSKLI